MNLFKKIISAVALMALLSGVFTTGVNAASSAQIEAANYLAAEGIIVSHTDDPTLYNLDQPVLRQEVAAVARGIADVPKATAYKGYFKDVTATTPNNWAWASVEPLREAGLIAANENFNPERNISKAEAIGMVVKAVFGDEYQYDSSLTTTWQQQVVAFAVKNGVLSTSFTNYDIPATRGFVFEAGSNAKQAIVEDPNGDDVCQILLQLGLVDSCGTTTNPPVTPPINTGSTTNPPIVVTGGNLGVTLNPASPTSRTVPSSGIVPFGKFDFTAGNQDVAIDSITIKREGLSNRSDIRRVYFERNGIRVSNRTSIAMDDTAIVTFTPALVVRAGSTETLDLIVELAEDPDGSGPLTGATVGAEHDFAITEVTGVSAQGLPVRTALMRIGSYAVPAVTIDAVRTDTTYNVGQENALIANFRVENSGERNNIFKSITLRNNGTADIAGSLSKVRVLNDGREISSRVEIVGRDITIEVNDEIVNGRSKTYEVRADIVSAERNGETYQLYVRNSTDLTVIEKETGFSAPITGDVGLPSAGTAIPAPTGTIEAEWGLITVNGGDFLIARDTSYDLNKTVSSSTNDVVLYAAKINSRENVSLESGVEAKFTAFNGSGGSLSNLTDFSSLKLTVNDVTVGTFVPTNTSGLIVDFDSTFTIRAGISTIKITGNLKNNVNNGNRFNVSNVAYQEIRYVSNDELVNPAGSAAGISVTVADGVLNLVRNDGIDNNLIVSGAQNKLVLGFSLRASDVSNVKLSAVKPNVILTDSSGSNLQSSLVSNYRLYANDALIKTSNLADFSGLDYTINKSQSVNFKIVADFSNSIAPSSTYRITIPTLTGIQARNVDSNKDITVANSAESVVFTFTGGGKALVTENGSQISRTILTPGSEIPVFKFDIEADDDNLLVTDIYVTNIAATTDTTSAQNAVTAAQSGVTSAQAALSAAQSDATTAKTNAQSGATNAASSGTALDAATGALSAYSNIVSQLVASGSSFTSTGDVVNAVSALDINTFNLVVTAQTGLTTAQSTLASAQATLAATSNPVNFADAVKSSSLTIGGKTFVGDIFSNTVLHFGLSSDFKVSLDQVVTGEVRVAFHDSSSRTNKAMQLAITATSPIGATTGTNKSMRILSESTGDNITRDSNDIRGNNHLVMRSKPTVTMSSFTPSSTDMYKFTVTADANRKITLNSLTLGISGTAGSKMGSATISVYRDTNGSNLVGTLSNSGSGNVTIPLTGSSSKEIAAGSTVTFYVQITGDSATKDDRRETKITGLTYTDDVTGSTPVQVSPYNVGIETTISSYTY